MKELLQKAEAKLNSECVLKLSAYKPVAEMAELIQDLSTALKRMEWQPIETAPKDGTEVLLYWGGHYFLARYCFLASHCGSEWVAQFYDGGRDEVFQEVVTPTHWMPLPEKPEVKE